jgi:hypothetical protein
LRRGRGRRTDRRADQHDDRRRCSGRGVADATVNVRSAARGEVADNAHVAATGHAVVPQTVRLDAGDPGVGVSRRRADPNVRNVFAGAGEGSPGKTGSTVMRGGRRRAAAGHRQDDWLVMAASKPPKASPRRPMGQSCHAQGPGRKSSNSHQGPANDPEGDGWANWAELATALVRLKAELEEILERFSFLSSQIRWLTGRGLIHDL